ncbi:AAA family ATPase [Massiliimalia timonensis]|uniref:AAA family ATPase n=1 Tax=Massiliimalia timonensis TaxID=1987501 RepID=UPI00189D2476|nr:ATP-binding protein [Massiliimalia timonensis]
MRLNKVIIENFKGFREFELTLDGKSTVLFGVNGTGKSTILSAINYCFWTWLNRLNPSQKTAYRSFEAKSIHYGTSKLEIQCVVETDHYTHNLSRNYVKVQSGKKAVSGYEKKVYDDFVDIFRKLYLTEDENMPVFVNYGTNRAVLDIPLRIRKKHDFLKLGALECAIENKLDFRTFFEWYRNQEDIENEYIRESGERNYQDKYLKCVRYAIETILYVPDSTKRENSICHY